LKPAQYFRAGVGIAVLDDDGRVLTLERADVPGRWQLPQGGIENGEQPQDAARRELWEETGLDWDAVELLGEHPGWLAYELPRDSWSAKTGRGQAQRWFVVRLIDPSAVLVLDHVGPGEEQAEFRAYKWADWDELIGGAVAYRRPTYEQLASFARPLAA
jgi:putative (di)nucleoside polyphosphate hydrolase